LASFLVDTPLLSEVSVFDLGIKVLDLIRRIHRVGFVFNLLDPEHIYLHPDSHSHFEWESCFLNDDLQLRGFSGCSDLNLKRSRQANSKLLRSVHSLYASASVMKGEATSQRDDLISLFYLLTVLLNEGRFMKMSCQAALNLDSRQILNYKTSHSIKDLCSGPTACLKKLMVLIFSLDRGDEPPYQEIRKNLVRLKQQAQERAQL